MIEQLLAKIQNGDLASDSDSMPPQIIKIKDNADGPLMNYQGDEESNNESMVEHHIDEINRKIS